VPAILARNRLCGLRDPGYGPGDSKATLRSPQACLTIQRHWHPRPTVQGTHYGQTKRFLRETFRPVASVRDRGMRKNIPPEALRDFVAAGRELGSRTWDEMPKVAVPPAPRRAALEVVYA
jgi:hypothetical protein